MNKPLRETPKFWQGKRGEYLVLVQFLLMFGFALWPVWNPWLTLADLVALAPWRWTALILCGIVALVFGALGSHALKRYLTPLPYPVDHSQLVQHGVYGLVRHPLYSSLLFAALGWTLFSLSLAHALLLPIGVLFFTYKAGREEAWLTERHPEYAAYARRVKKFIPWIY